MGVTRRRRHHSSLLFATLAFLLLTSITASAFSRLGRSPKPGKALHEPLTEVPARLEGERGSHREMGEKRLSGPGSSPPSCRSKCGKCWPCKPVHVPIQPGVSIPLEYYPEAWRCKCGNKLFMP